MLFGLFYARAMFVNSLCRLLEVKLFQMKSRAQPSSFFTAFFTKYSVQFRVIDLPPNFFWNPTILGWISFIYFVVLSSNKTGRYLQICHPLTQFFELRRFLEWQGKRGLIPFVSQEQCYNTKHRLACTRSESSGCAEFYLWSYFYISQSSLASPTSLT